MRQLITDPVEIAEELPKWQNKEVTVYVTLNPYVELGLKSKLIIAASGDWSVQLGSKEAATAILFTSKGVTDLRRKENELHISIYLATPQATGEFT